MALKKIITLTGDRVLQTPFGLINEGSATVSIAATIRVIEITGNANQINARVRFTDELIRIEKYYVVPVSIEDNAPNFICQEYLHLKTLPEFDNCEDC